MASGRNTVIYRSVPEAVYFFAENTNQMMLDARKTAARQPVRALSLSHSNSLMSKSCTSFYTLTETCSQPETSVSWKCRPQYGLWQKPIRPQRKACVSSCRCASNVERLARKHCASRHAWWFTKAVAALCARSAPLLLCVLVE